MRLAVWNLGHWQRSAKQLARCWSILEDLSVDVALLQEAVPPTERGLSTVYRAIGGPRPWGSAVVGLTMPLEEVSEAKGRYNAEAVPLRGVWRGSVAVAAGDLARHRVTFVSIYGLIDDGYADTTVNRQLSDLSPLFDDPRHERHLVLGGDLNISTQWVGDNAHYRERDAATLGRIRAFGLVDILDQHRQDGPLEGCDCLDDQACRHVQTQRHPNSSRPWQNDYVFASHELASRSTRCDVVDSEAIEALGGHLPIIADIDLS